MMNHAQLRVEANRLMWKLHRAFGRDYAVRLMGQYNIGRGTHMRDASEHQLRCLISHACKQLELRNIPTETKPMNKSDPNPVDTSTDDYNFFFVASKARLPNGTPFMRHRFATEKEAIAIATTWAEKSEHGGEYIVFKCVAVGEAQRSAPPVAYRKIKAKRVRASKRK